MAQIVVMPALGNTVESCLVNTWLVSVGDTVDENTVVAEIETDKATMDLPAGASGTVLALLAEEGDDVPVKQALFILGDPGENIDNLLAEAGAAPAAEASEPAASAEPHSQQAATEQAAPASAAPAESASPTGEQAISPRARNLAAQAGVPTDVLTAGTGPHGRVIERDVQAALASGRPLGSARGADVSGVTGSGIGGRVTASDLDAASSAPQAAPTAVPLASLVGSTEFPGRFTDTPLKGIRKIVAERMMNALATSAQLTYTVTAPADGMLALRKRFKGSDPELGFSAITLGDLICFATVQVLKRHANLNAHLLDSGLRTFDSVHLGLAVDTPRGLLVPTIRNADAMSLRQLSAATKDLAAAAISGKIDPELLSGATFTVSNLGSFGMEHFTPIINVPQTGILGVNTIVPRAKANADGSVGIEQRLGLSLTADHQVVDGADAARFLKDLSAAIAAIDLTVMG